MWDWFNYYGLIIVVLMMVPNVLLLFKKDDNSFKNYFSNPFIELVENIARYGCLILMIINIPDTYQGFYFASCQWIYIGVNSVLILSYLISWLLFWKKDNLVKTLLLSIIPSAIFLFSGTLILNIPLTILAIMFA